eukprot:GHRR01009048.1.p1 GENE.GHRR01009048.1~~GHRR01009048.1.p1  ORF type:complete len:266 (+),score=104.86 GHRR01009048.1:1276-2073(+)
MCAVVFLHLQHHTYILDPPSIIFITRLHLMNVARRKVAAAAGVEGTVGAGSSRARRSKHPTRIPPPVELPAWAQQQLQQLETQSQLTQWQQQWPSQEQEPQPNQGQQLQQLWQQHPQLGQQQDAQHQSSARSTAAIDQSCSPSAAQRSGQQLRQGSSNNGGSSSKLSSSACSSNSSVSTDRRLEDAPDLLCCPITGQIMLQPVTVPSGKTFEYEAVRKWITQHGSDPTTLTPISILDLHPNLVVREMVEKWLEDKDPLADSGDDE